MNEEVGIDKVRWVLGDGLRGRTAAWEVGG